MDDMNVGSVERFLRIFIGTVFAFLAVMGKIGGWGYLGLILTATGLMGMCPLYVVLGVSTCPAQSKDSSAHH